MNRSVIALFACTFIVVGAVLYWAFSTEVPTAPPEAGNKELTTMSFAGNTVSEEKDGRKLWDLTADTIDVDPETKNMTFKNLTGVFYQANGKSITLTAPTAYYDTKLRDLSISGGVAAQMSDGATFAAEKVFWQSESEVFRGEGGVKAAKDDTVITGDQIQTDAGMNKIKVTGNARIIKQGAAK